MQRNLALADAAKLVGVANVNEVHIMNHSDKQAVDVIVIGSGMGGMTTAAALSKVGHKVVVLEQAPFVGGLTHSFSREGFTWDVGLHYCGTFGHDQPGGKILDWLSDTSIQFTSVGPVYDTLHFPGGFELPVSRPAAAYKMELNERFPGHEAEIAAYFAAIEAGATAVQMVTGERGMPGPIKSIHRWWNRKMIEDWCGQTTGDVIAGITKDIRLQAVLSAQWGDYGGRPKDASFGVHAMIMGHYLDGAGYPVGGAKIAERLLPTIEKAGGAIKTNAPVSAIIIENGHAVGVRTVAGEELRAPVIVSAAGARDTVMRLIPRLAETQSWADEVASFQPSVCHWALYLGFEGDISQHGATKSNHWFYESWDTNDGIWFDPDGNVTPRPAETPHRRAVDVGRLVYGREIR
jgi:all-trans-retinol 13,14-reductase